MGGFSNYGQAVGQLLNSGQQVTNNSLKSNGINPQDATIHSPPAPNSPFNKPPPNPAPVSVPPPHPPSSFSPPKVSASSINRPNQPSRPTSTSRSGLSNSLPAVSKSLATLIPSSGADPKTNHPGSQFSNSQQQLQTRSTSQLGRTQDGNAGPRATNTVGSLNPAQQASPVSPARQSQGSDSNGSPKQSRQPESVIPTSLQQSTATQAPKQSQPIRPSRQSQVAQSPKSIVAARPSESAQLGVQQSAEAPPQDVKPTPVATKQSQAAKLPHPSPSSQQAAQAPTVPRQSQAAKLPQPSQSAQQSAQPPTVPKQSQAVKQPQSAEPVQGSNQAPATPRQSQAVKQTQPAAPAQVSKQGSNSSRQSQAVQQPQSVSPKQATKQPQSGASTQKPKEQR
jgi:hypothetical protein